MALLALFSDRQSQSFIFLLTNINKTLGKLTEGVSPAETSVVERLDKIDTTLKEGLAALTAAVTELNHPGIPDNQLEVRFVFKVANNHQDEPFSIAIGGVTDAEGEALPDTSGLTVAVSSSDEGVVGVSFDPATNSGNVTFGRSGVASLTASVTNAAGEILGSGAADFTVTTGDPAAVSDVRISFSGLTEEAPEGGGNTGGGEPA